MKDFSRKPLRALMLLYWLSILTLPNCAAEFLEHCSIQVGDRQFLVEIARTAAQRQRGLMGRDSLSNGEGMLFIFPHPQMVSFWMKDTAIPLTVGYFNDLGILVELHDLTPYSLRSVPSSQPIRYALELEQGEFQRQRIELGAQLLINCSLTLLPPPLALQRRVQTLAFHFLHRAH